MLNAYRSGIPANDKSVPDGAVVAKIEWAKSKDAASPYDVTVPGKLNNVAFMVKDSRRFPDTDGWGYAQFRYDGASRTWTAFGDGEGFAKAACHQCHANVKARDFVFTHYAER
jgi:hypothetical protein